MEKSKSVNGILLTGIYFMASFLASHTSSAEAVMSTAKFSEGKLVL